MAALVLVCGGPASGKTATAHAVAAALTEAGMRVVVVSEEGDPATLYAGEVFGAELSFEFFPLFFSPSLDPFAHLVPAKLKEKKTSRLSPDPPSEKQTRGALRSRVDRALAFSKPAPAVVVDGCNAVKGFRYELWCLGRPSGARFCCVFCPEPGSSSGGGGGGSASSSLSPPPSTDDEKAALIGRWPRALFEDLAARVEPPDPRNRWEQPLFVADARRAATEGTERAGGALPVRPAPASLPAGGRGGAAEETAGWPLDAVAAAVVAAVASAPGRGAPAKTKAGSALAAAAAAAAASSQASPSAAAAAAAAAAAPLRETLPLATASVALRPAKCTLSARVAGADALGDLDAAAQAVLMAVAAALPGPPSAASPSASASAAAANGRVAAAARPCEAASFAAIEIPLSPDAAADSDAAADGAGDAAAREQRRGRDDPLTLALRRAPSLAELRRHKRDFLRAATAPMAGPLPRGARAGASAFCEYLKRRVV